MAVEAKLEVQTLKEKQELERKLEEVERSKAELNRKLELLSAKTKMEQAEIDLLLERGEENEAKDGMNDYLKEHGANYPPAKGHLSQPVAGGASPSSESQPVVDNGKMQTSSAQDIAQTSLSSLVTASYVTSGSAVTTSAPNVGRVAIHKTSSSSLTTLAPSICTKSSTPISYAPRFNLPRATSTAVAASPLSMHQSQGMSTWSCSPRTVGLDASATEFYPANTPQQSTSTYIYSTPPFEQRASPQSRMQPDPWVAVAEAIKQGPSLPKVELMKFSGDPLEYVEFVTNFRDNIENQVSDESQRLTRLLAQCSSKAKEAIRSCVNLTVGERYTEAWRTLSENFGQPHMIVEAHMKKLREIQVRKADATTLMEFVRRLEDARRVLTSMGHNYGSRLDNEDVIISLMRKLPDEGLKRKWVDKAGDLIKRKGRADFADFVEFVRRVADRINNRYGQELGSSSPGNREKKDPNKIKDPPPKFTTLATQTDQNCLSQKGPLRPPWKCTPCSEPHNVWRCRKFRSASLNDRLKTVRQRGLSRLCLDQGHTAKQCDKGSPAEYQVAARITTTCYIPRRRVLMKRTLEIPAVMRWKVQRTVAMCKRPTRRIAALRWQVQGNRIRSRLLRSKRADPEYALRYFQSRLDVREAPERS